VANPRTLGEACFSREMVWCQNEFLMFGGRDGEICKLKCRLLCGNREQPKMPRLRESKYVLPRAPYFCSSAEGQYPSRTQAYGYIRTADRGRGCRLGFTCYRIFGISYSSP
jgi:hypothetical protein